MPGFLVVWWSGDIETQNSEAVSCNNVTFDTRYGCMHPRSVNDPEFAYSSKGYVKIYIFGVMKNIALNRSSPYCP